MRGRVLNLKTPQIKSFHFFFAGGGEVSRRFIFFLDNINCQSRGFLSELGARVSCVNFSYIATNLKKSKIFLTNTDFHGCPLLLECFLKCPWGNFTLVPSGRKAGECQLHIFGVSLKFSHQLITAYYLRKHEVSMTIVDPVC